MTDRDLGEEIDDLSRELTEEIEAHRLTRERAEKAEDAAGRLGEDLLVARRERDKARRVATVLERQLETEREWYAAAKRGLDEANARLAELVSEVMDWMESADGVVAPWLKLAIILEKYDGAEHG